jgi:phosphoribosylaminoimidazole-succinocarboxamide synthase
VKVNYLFFQGLCFEICEESMNYLTNLITPQLEKIHSGKVRESFRVDKKTRMIVATDRLSSFDRVLKTAIPAKGAVLNTLAAYWFENTRDIIDNHFIKMIDPNISLVREAKPVLVEMVVRGYLTGSAWRSYQNGKREVSGVSIPEGMKKNQAFPEPILTPTTKEKNDREISAGDLVKEGWTTGDIYREMETASLALFQKGSQILADRGIILVDTKYEFGLIGGKLVLIDEIHTPDSSRFWSKKDYEKNPGEAEQLDKEYVRNYLMTHKIEGEYPSELPEEVVKETTRRYQAIFQMITDKSAPQPDENIQGRIYSNLVREGLIKEGFVSIIMGSPSDEDHCNKIKKIIESYEIKAELRVVSAHKNGEEIPKLVRDYNESVEPGAVIAVAGRSNGLGGALSANLAIPVFNCPPFSDKTDIMLNINSSLMMPSSAPAATVIDIKNAAMAALRSLNIPRLRKLFTEEIREMKDELIKADEKMRNV